MRVRILHWLGEEFVALECDGDGGGASTQVREVFQRMGSVLGEHGLTLADTVRTRLWARDRASRDAGSLERYRVLAGPARSASSSYIAPERLSVAPSLISVDLLAMRPPAGAIKVAVEREPPGIPIRYVTIGSACFLSGVTCPSGMLDEQVADIIPRIGDSLRAAGSGWDHVARAAVFLHHSQSIDRLRTLLLPRVSSDRLVIGVVDGYSSQGKLVEIEITARAAKPS